ncbi:MAG: type II toxin-antitoxin system VapC family toxin [Aeromicrobium sp.]
MQSTATVFFSPITTWELTIKHLKGRLAYEPQEIVVGALNAGMEELPVAQRHVRLLPDLRLPHGGPFDAMLMAQVVADGLTLVTADRNLLGSPHPTLDARS